MRRLFNTLMATALALLTTLPTAAQRVEYFWDNDPGVGKGRLLRQFSGNEANISVQLDASALPVGIHQLGIRALNGTNFSATYYRLFYVPAAPHQVQAIEYFYDTDPGVGCGTRLAATISGESLTKAFSVNTDGLTDGVHKIGLRTLTDGTWSATYYRQFLVQTVTDKDITRLEYFWDNDPGAGKGYVVDITPGEEVDLEFEADMFELDAGTHTLGLRAQSATGGWSTTSLTKNIDFEGWDALQAYLNSLVDTNDSYSSGVYKRQYLNKEWHALYVPFTLQYSDWSAHFDVARINAFYQYDDNEDGIVDRQVLEAIIVKPGNGNLKANHPYLIRPKTTGSYSFNIPASRRVAQKVNSVSCSTLEAKYTFTGNYSNITGLKSAQRYRLRGGSLSVPDKDDEVLPPYRWYLTVDDLGNQLAPAASSRIDINVLGEDDVTDIKGATPLTPDENKRSIYDLQGRRMNNDSQLRPGLYIINNKKCVIK